MKSSVLFLAMLGASLASHAQQPPASGATPAAIDASKAQQVASPNRTASPTWVASGKAGKARHQGEKADAGPIVWVDSTGRTVGRAIGNFAILTMYDDQLATITGLGSDSHCDANRVCTFASNGARWSEFEAVYYTSSDCTGVPYALGAALGTPYVGIPITDSGGTYLYFFKAVDTTRVTLNSRYSSNTCSALGIRGAFPTDAIPVSGVLPASNYGTPPFFLK